MAHMRRTLLGGASYHYDVINHLLLFRSSFFQGSHNIVFDPLGSFWWFDLTVQSASFQLLREGSIPTLKISVKLAEEYIIIKSWNESCPMFVRRFRWITVYTIYYTSLYRFRLDKSGFFVFSDSKNKLKVDEAHKDKIIYLFRVFGWELIVRYIVGRDGCETSW